MWREVILTEDPKAAAEIVTRDAVYLKFLSDMGLPAPHPKPAGKPYVAKIYGLSSQYGLDRQFLSYTKTHIVDPTKPELSTQYVYNLDPGFYEIQKHKDGTPVRGFVKVIQAHSHEGSLIAMEATTLRDILLHFVPERKELI